MNENDFQLSAAIDQLLKNHNRGNILVEGTVVAINDDYTCDVKIGEITQYSVPLKIVTNAQASVYEIPVVNTGCLITFRDGNISRPQIVIVDQVDQLLINCKTLVQFNGGELGGIVKVEDLVTKLNNLENLVNELVAKYNAHTHILTLTSGTGTAAPTTMDEATVLTPTERGDIEDTKIKH